MVLTPPFLLICFHFRIQLLYFLKKGYQEVSYKGERQYWKKKKNPQNYIEHNNERTIFLKKKLRLGLTSIEKKRLTS